MLIKRDVLVPLVKTDKIVHLIDHRMVFFEEFS
jgi:hypothetical protein